MENKELTDDQMQEAVDQAVEEVKEAQSQMDPSDEQPTPRLFELADFVSTCSCGNTDVIIPNTRDGVKLELYPTDMHEMSVGCSKCGTVIKLHFREAFEMTNEEAQELVDKGEAEIPTEPEVNSEVVVENKEVENEEPIHEENTETKSV